MIDVADAALIAPLPTLSLVMPAHNARHYLVQSLPPLSAAVGADLLECIVVDDASKDGSGEVARSLGAKVVTLRTRGGPAAARNVGAECAAGDVVVFVDADVLVTPESLRRIRAWMAEGSIAIFGSYDDDPAARNAASLYMNLRHHLVHQTGSGPARTFWSGIGALPRAAFLDVGGFDAKRYPEPMVEDIELGGRLVRHGLPIRLDGAIVGKHLKRWRWREILRTDCLCRALPWSRLLVREGSEFFGLNVRKSERLRAMAAIGAWLAIAAAAIGALPVWAALGALALSLGANAEFGRLLWKRGGAYAAAVGLLYHQVYYLYSVSIFGACWVAAAVRGRRRV